MDPKRLGETSCYNEDTLWTVESHVFRSCHGLFGVIDTDHQSSYLSGSLIGSEMIELGGHFWNLDELVLLVGTTVSAQIYGTAFYYMTIPY